MLEAGEAADEEAVAEKVKMKRAAAQIKNSTRGDLTAEEAIAQAAAEGLRLVPAICEMGYKGVSRDGCRYRVQHTEHHSHRMSAVIGHETHVTYVSLVSRAPSPRPRAARPRGARLVSSA